MNKTLIIICSLLFLTACTSSQKPLEITEEKNKNTDEIVATETTTADLSTTDSPTTEVTNIETSDGDFKENRSLKSGSCGEDNCRSIIDSESFKTLNYYYSKDKNHVYYIHGNYQVLENLDPNSFEVVNQDFTKDKNGVYYIWEGETLNISVLDSNPIFFEINPDGFAKDDKHVFVHPKFKDSQLVCVVEGADPATFHAIGGGWQKDKSHIFYWDNMEERVDFASFEVLPDNVFCYDNNGVYYCRGGSLLELPGADRNSITVLGGSNSSTITTAEDKDHFYELRSGASPWHIFKKGVDPLMAFDFAAATGILNGLDGLVSTAHEESSRGLVRSDVAAIASRLVMGINEYNNSTLSGSYLKKQLDLLYTDVPPNEWWNVWILKAMYYSNQYGVMSGDGNIEPTTFRPTEAATGLDLVKTIYAILANKNESWNDFLTRLKSSGVLSNFDSSDTGFIEFPFYYENDINGPTDTFRIGFQQTMLYEDAGVLIQALMMKKLINIPPS